MSTIQGPTPGPWAMDTGTDGAVVYDPNAGTIANIPMDLRAWQANARLIAAAPDAVEALENARIALRFYREWMTAHCPEGNGSTNYPFGIAAEKQATAALAKARGTGEGV